MSRQAVGDLIAAHLELARKAAAMLYPRVKQHIEFEELVALGNAGLTEAANRYDPTAGASFATFAWYRVYGAIVDGLRKQTTLSRATWAKLLALRAASDYLESQGARAQAANRAAPTAPTTGQTLDEVRAAIAAIQTIYVTSLEAQRDAGFDVRDEHAVDPAAAIDQDRLGQRARAALARMPDRERELLTKHYFEGKNLLEAGAEMGISKSWASRMHAQAIDRLRGLMDADTP